MWGIPQAGNRLYQRCLQCGRGCSSSAEWNWPLTPMLLPISIAIVLQKYALLLAYKYIYIYIYLYAVKLLSGPSLGFSKVINWAKSKLLSGPSWFSHYKNRGFRRFFAQLSFCVFFCVQLFANFLKIAFFFEKKRVQNWVFQISLF